MNSRYISGRELDNIGVKSGDSNGWKSILNAREKIRSCVELGANREIQWKGVGDSATQANIYKTM